LMDEYEALILTLDMALKPLPLAALTEDVLALPPSIM